MQHGPWDFHISFHAAVQRCNRILLSSHGEDVTAIAVATVAFLVALVLVLERPLIVQKLVIPLAVTSLHPDRMPTLEGIAAIENFVSVIGGIAAIVGSLLLGYACLWRYVALRLPRSVGLPREAVISSVSPRCGPRSRVCGRSFFECRRSVGTANNRPARKPMAAAPRANSVGWRRARSSVSATISLHCRSRIRREKSSIRSAA